MRDWGIGRRLAFATLAAAGLFVLLYAGLLWGNRSPGTLAPEGEGPPDEYRSLLDQPSAPPDDGRLNLLICGVDETHYLTDVIMLASLEEESGLVSVLQIPRDTYVGNSLVPTGKLNAVYGQKNGGIQELERQVEDLLRLPVDYYITVTLEGVRSIVDDLGGIPMTLEEPIDYLPGKSLAAGEYLLTGEQAEWLVRYREGYATGDIGRLGIQKQFLQAAIDAVHEKGRSEAIGALIRNYSSVKTDMPLVQMVSLGGKVFDLGTDAISFCLLPGEGAMVDGYAVYLPDREALEEIASQYFGSEPPLEDTEKGAVP